MKRFIFLFVLFLACSTFGDVVRPIKEYVGDFDELSVIRDSNAYDKDFNQVDAHVGRTESICITTRANLEIDRGSNKLCYAVDTWRGCVLCGTNYKLYATNSEDFGDGSNPIYTTVIASISGPPFDDGVGGNSITSLTVLPNGRWLLGLNQTGGGCIYISDNRGTTWTKAEIADSPTNQFDVGYVPAFGWNGVRGNKIVVGEYGCKNLADTPRRIYLSEDYGSTWTKIYTHCRREEQHCHTVTFAPNNTDVVYAAYGDGPGAQEIIKIAKTAGSWTPDGNAVRIRPYQPVTLFSDGRHIYVGHDGTDTSATIERLDPCDDSIAPVLWIPRSVPSYAEYCPYDYMTGNAYVWDILIYDGVYYAAATDPDPGPGGKKAGGIYVSPDGENWTSAYRVQDGVTIGVRSLKGYTDGYLWGSIQDTTFGCRLFRMKPMKVTAGRGLRAEKGITNLFVKSSPGIGQYSADDSYFKESLGKWFLSKSYNSTESGWKGDDSLLGGHCLKLVGEYDGSHKSVNISSGKLSEYGITTTDGELFCVSVWLKAATTWPNEFMCRLSFVYGQGYNVWYYSPYLIPATEWTQYKIWGKFTGPINANERFYISVYDVSQSYPAGDYGNVKLWMDCPQLVKSTRLWYSSSLFQPGGDGTKLLPRADEYATAPMTELGSNYSVSFDWLPQSSDREFTTNVYIASIVGNDGSYIDLLYDKTNSKFKMIDDSNDTVSTSDTYTWEHPDFIRFCITSDGTNSKFYIETSLNSRETVNLTAVNLTSSPSYLKLSTDYSGTDFGCGVFANIRMWDVELSASDVNDVFNTVGPMLAGSLLGDLTGDGKIDFEDLAKLIGRWLWVGQPGGIPEDITVDGIVNLRDLAELVEHRLEEN